MVSGKSQRNTRQRQVVLEELGKLTSHPTAVELFEIARARLPKISLATVYRNLDRLVASGAVQKLEFAGSEARFDCDAEQHYHVRCVHCEQVADVHDLPAGFVKPDVKSLGGHEILGHRLEFIGVCPQCKGRPSTENVTTE